MIDRMSQLIHVCISLFDYNLENRDSFHAIYERVFFIKLNKVDGFQGWLINAKIGHFSPIYWIYHINIYPVGQFQLVFV